MLINLINKIFSYFGYYRTEDFDRILEENEDYSTERPLLLKTINMLERVSSEQNLLLTSIIVAQGQEEMVLTQAFISDIVNKDLETVFSETTSNDVKLTVQVREQICENCNGTCDVCE